MQDALDRASATRTTLLIAHRLSTVQNASQIVVMGNGTVLEVGSHEVLSPQNRQLNPRTQLQAAGLHFGIVLDPFLSFPGITGFEWPLH